MADSSKDSASAVPGVIAILLLAAGVLVQQIPLERTRPVTKTKPVELPDGLQTVPARLWQDPIDAARRDWQSLLAKGESGQNAFNGKSESFKRELKNVISQKCGENVEMMDTNCVTMTVLGVSIFGGGYSENVESRRRSRYAVLSALSASGMRPHDSGHIDYVPMELAAGSTQAPWVIPYELFVDQAWDRHIHGSEGKPDRSGRMVLVLWIDDQKPPLESFTRAIARLDVAPIVRHRKLILASGTEALKSVIEETKDKSDGSVEILSANSTVTDEFLQEPVSDPEFWKDRKIIRTIGTDERLVLALRKELKLRRVVPGCDSGPMPGFQKRGDLLLVSEWDTTYSRALPDTFENELLAIGCDGEAMEENGAPATEWLHRVTYMRGLDGELLEDNLRISDTRSSGGGTRPNDDKDQAGNQQSAPDRARSLRKERAEGDSQFDYVRRINDRIADINARIEKDNREIMAVGVLGSDYYDKLLILQALRKSYPRALFFTTDVDARLLQEDQYPWTRNLLVASHYGLELNPTLQGGLPAFRDNYQTSTFLATRLAIETACQRGLDAERLNMFFLAPRVYEIGRSGLVDLARVDPKAFTNAKTGGALCADSGEQSKFGEVTSIHSEEPQVDYGVRIARYLLISVGIVFGILFLSSRVYEVVAGTITTHKVLTACAIVGAAIALFLFYRWILLGVDEEPVAWFEGVSVWVSELIRIIALLISLFFLCKIERDIRKSDTRLGHDFFPDVTPIALSSSSLGQALRQLLWGKPNAICGYLRETWGGLREFLHPWNYKTHRVPGDSVGADDKIDVNGLWRDLYLKAGSCGVRQMRALIGTCVFIGVGFLLSIPEMPVRPVRGSISNAVDILLTIATVVVYTFLVFYVVDAVRLCKSFVQHLASGKSEWSINTVEKFTKIQQLGSSADNLRTVLKRDNYLRDYIDMRLIAERTEVIGGTIYYPFITLLLIIIARSSLLDNWFWNTALVVMLAASAAVIACSAYSLRSAAEHARELALRKLGSELLRAEARQDDLATKLLGTSIEAVKNVSEGAYRSFLQQPIVRALFIPFGGYGGLALVEFLVLGKA